VYSEVDIDELSNLEWDSGQYADRIEIGGETSYGKSSGKLNWDARFDF